MAIEELGESLLAQARSRRKKQEKKAKLFTGLMLGVQGANFLLRRRAKKRWDEINSGYTDLISSETQRLKDGVKFWSEHNQMLTQQKSSHEQWRDAYTAREREKLIKQYKLSANNNTIEEINNIVNNLVKDDLEAYQKKIDAYSEFKSYKDTKEDITRYFAPVAKVMTETKDAIEKNASVGGKIASALGFDDYKVDMDKEFNKVQIAGNIDTEDKKRFEKFLSTSTDNMTKLSQADDGVDYKLVMTEQQLSRFKTEPTFKVDKDIESFTTAYLNPDLTEEQRSQMASITTEFSLIDNPDKKETFNYYTISDSLPAIPAKGQSMSQRQLFQRDVDRVASIKKSIYKANAEGVEGFIQMPSDIEIVQEALDFVVDKNKLVLSAEPVDRLVFANTKAEFQYNRLTAEDFASAASERPQQIPENTSYELSEEANELVGTPTQEGRKPSFENITTSETVSLAKALSKDKDFINEPIEVIRSSYDSMLNKLPKDDVANRTLIQNELDKILDMKQKGKVDETKVNTFGSILDKDFRKSFEEEREKQERVPLLKVLGLDKESKRNRLIKNAEQFVDGKRVSFISPEFSRWLKSTKGLNITELKKEDKPELVSEFLEFLKEA
tara:strand:+ start:1414 stop:3252 length:1839 start_codon:yes stop_codon:yes gene_type:complete